MTTTARIAREAQLDLAFAGQKFTIVDVVNLPATEPKFVAWITGARGRSGYAIMNDVSGEIRIVGLTTLNDANDRGAITNMDMVANGNGKPSRGRTATEALSATASANADLIARIQAKHASATAAKPVDAPTTTRKPAASKAIEAK